MIIRAHPNGKSIKRKDKKRKIAQGRKDSEYNSIGEILLARQENYFLESGNRMKQRTDTFSHL